MALSVDTFNDGDTALVAQAYRLALDLKDGKGYRVLCNDGLEESLNESLDSRFTLCGEGTSTNTITTNDYTIAVAAIVKKSTLTDDLQSKKFKSSERNSVGVRLDNTLTDERTEFDGVFKIDTIGGSADAIIEITGEIKVASGTPILTEGIPEDVTGALTAGVITADSIEVLVDLQGSSGSVALSLAGASNTVISAQNVVEGLATSVMFDTLSPETDYEINLFDNTNTVIDTLTVSTIAL